jgi:hypothetical protein
MSKMNEIDLLRDLRSGLPSPRAESRATARGLLVAQIQRADRPPTRQRSRRARAGLFAAAALIAALLIALPSLMFGGDAPVQPAVGQVLRQVATVAAAQPPEPRPGPGQYFYTRSREAYASTRGRGEVLTPRIRQTWIAANGAGRARVAYGSGEVEDIALTGQPFLDTRALPTQPEALRKLIEARKVPLMDGPPGEAETFTLIGDMLRNTYLPPAFRATLYRVVAELPRVELEGEVKDPVGRMGIGVASTKGSTTHELIFDPDTSALLGERELAATRIPELRVPAGTEIGSIAYLEQRVVDSLAKGAIGQRSTAGS